VATDVYSKADVKLDSRRETANGTSAASPYAAHRDAPILRRAQQSRSHTATSLHYLSASPWGACRPTRRAISRLAEDNRLKVSPNDDACCLSGCLRQSFDANGMELSPSLLGRPCPLSKRTTSARYIAVFFVVVHPRNAVRVAVTVCSCAEVSVMPFESGRHAPVVASGSLLFR
jgi:hypothetical protein